MKRAEKIIHDVHRKWEQAQLPVRVARDPVLSASSTIPGGCGSCSSVGEDMLTVPVVGDIDASTLYRMQLFCGGDNFLFEWDSVLTWLVGGDPFELDCADAAPWSLDFSMVSTGTAAGLVQVFAKDGGSTKARWVSDTIWQPCIYVVMKLVEYDDDCPCAPWKPETCLLPVQAP